MSESTEKIIDFLIKYKIGVTQLFGTDCTKIGMPILSKCCDEYFIGDVIHIEKDLNKMFKWRNITIHIFNTKYQNALISVGSMSTNKTYKLNIFLVLIIKLFKVKCR